MDIPKSLVPHPARYERALNPEVWESPFPRLLRAHTGDHMVHSRTTHGSQHPGGV